MVGACAGQADAPPTRVREAGTAKRFQLMTRQLITTAGQPPHRLTGQCPLTRPAFQRASSLPDPSLMLISPLTIIINSDECKRKLL